MKSPYSVQPPRAFWSKSISRVAREHVDPVSKAGLTISTATRVATAGSCFAQHIARHLRKLGVEPLVTERPHIEVAGLGPDFHYGVYTARYGNVYTSRQLLQLERRAFGHFQPEERPWRGAGGEWVDPFRPLIPEGFATLRELEQDRDRHLSAVREMFTQLDVLVFTLGLTEMWCSKADGAVFPSCPGAIAGIWSPERYAFHNLTVNDVVSDLRRFVANLREVNPAARLLLTVSPVPLVATATDNHVLPATVYSKSVLRVAAQTVVDTIAGVEYFPSYEIITGPQAGTYFGHDRREVTPEGVEAVMRVFARHYVDGAEIAEPLAEAGEASRGDRATRRAQAAMDLICDELANDADAVGAA